MHITLILLIVLGTGVHSVALNGMEKLGWWQTWFPSQEYADELAREAATGDFTQKVLAMKYYDKEINAAQFVSKLDDLKQTRKSSQQEYEKWKQEKKAFYDREATVLERINELKNAIMKNDTKGAADALEQIDDAKSLYSWNEWWNDGPKFVYSDGTHYDKGFEYLYKESQRAELSRELLKLILTHGKMPACLPIIQAVQQKYDIQSLITCRSHYGRDIEKVEEYNRMLGENSDALNAFLQCGVRPSSKLTEYLISDCKKEAVEVLFNHSPHLLTKDLVLSMVARDDAPQFPMLTSVAKHIVEKFPMLPHDLMHRMASCRMYDSDLLEFYSDPLQFSQTREKRKISVLRWALKNKFNFNAEQKGKTVLDCAVLGACSIGEERNSYLLYCPAIFELLFRKGCKSNNLPQLLRATEEKMRIEGRIGQKYDPLVTKEEREERRAQLSYTTPNRIFTLLQKSAPEHDDAMEIV